MLKLSVAVYNKDGKCVSEIPVDTARHYTQWHAHNLEFSLLKCAIEWLQEFQNIKEQDFKKLTPAEITSEKAKFFDTVKHMLNEVLEAGKIIREDIPTIENETPV